LLNQSWTRENEVQFDVIKPKENETNFKSNESNLIFEKQTLNQWNKTTYDGISRIQMGNILQLNEIILQLPFKLRMTNSWTNCNIWWSRPKRNVIK
jgi:hypothetical protein